MTCFPREVTSTTKCVAMVVVVSPIDFTAVSQLLRIEACKTRKCVNISIINDFIKEEMESFNITLRRTENVPIAVTIDPAEAVVQIFKSKYMFRLRDCV